MDPITESIGPLRIKLFELKNLGQEGASSALTKLPVRRLNLSLSQPLLIHTRVSSGPIFDPKK